MTYKVCDGLTEALIYFSVIFTPWAFGTTQAWSIWTMNITCYILGGLLGAKWIIRRLTSFEPSRWGEVRDVEDFRIEDSGQRAVRWLTISLAALTVVILAYSLTGALNARATWYPLENRFDYHDFLPWLPHSYDRAGTWNGFWQYLGLALFFWSARDWLLGKAAKERRRSSGENRTRNEDVDPVQRDSREPEGPFGVFELAGAPHTPPASTRPRSPALALPTRLRRLLWVLCINGALLALEGTLQRLDGTDKLLWLVVPRFNTTDESQFGPYANRSNGAQYLNLVWPVCLGFWLVLRKASIRTPRGEARIGQGSYMVLFPCAVIMASAPIISTSRGGALITLAALPVASAIVFFAARRERALVRAGMLSLFVIILGFSVYLGWKHLAERLENMFVDNLSNRTEIYRNSRGIAQQFPVFGTGADSFAAIYQLYKEPNQTWEAYLHDDWLELRVTFGRVGFGMILIMLVLALVRWFVPGGIPGPWDLVSLIWLAMAGCLLHAKFDFPFRIYSIQWLFLLLSCVLFCLSRRGAVRE